MLQAEEVIEVLEGPQSEQKSGGGHLWEQGRYNLVKHMCKRDL